MKRQASIVVWLAAALVTSSAVADSPQKRRGPGHGGAAGHGAGFVGAVAQKLDLEDSQREELRQLAESRRETMRPLMEAARAARQSVARQIHSGDLDEQAIRAAVMEAAEIEADIAVERARMLMEMQEVLTLEQLEEAKALMESHTQRDGKRRGRGFHRSRAH